MCNMYQLILRWFSDCGYVSERIVQDFPTERAAIAFALSNGFSDYTVEKVR